MQTTRHKKQTSFAKNVILTSSSTSQLSKRRLMEWLDVKFGVTITNIEQLRTGSVYCQLMDKTFPGSIALKRIKFHTKLEHEYIQNFKLLQDSFNKKKVEKIIPIERLIKGCQQDNLEFLQWFKIFHDANVNGPAPIKSCLVVKKSINNSGSSVLSPLTRKSVRIKSMPIGLIKDVAKRKQIEQEQKQKRMAGLFDTIASLIIRKEELQNLRDSYYSKLRDIEVFCQIHDDSPVVKPILHILYKSEEGFYVPNKADTGNDMELHSDED